MPTPVKRPTSRFYWLRKKVPARIRPLLDEKYEVWESLGTTSRREATVKCAVRSAELEAGWVRLEALAIAEAAAAAAAEAALDEDPITDDPIVLDSPEDGTPIYSAKPCPPLLNHMELYAFQRAAHVGVRDAYIASPPTGWAALRIAALDEEASQNEALDILQRDGIDFSETDVARLAPLLIQARQDAAADVRRALDGDFSPNPALTKLPERTSPKLDIVKSFEEYVSKGGLKGGADGPTTKRWRPKIRLFVQWLGHRDLARMTTDDGYRWMDHLIEEGYAKKSIRDVWLAALSATAGFMVERRKLAQNPFHGIRVRGVKEGLDDDKKGFKPEQAKTILTATLADRSRLISRETWAARRWIPWLCAYTGARVNELTSLEVTDIEKIDGIWCVVIRPELEKTEKHRRVPVHPHVLEQGFLDYVEERRKAKKPLFYDPARGRGGKSANPQYKKVGERLCDWVHSLGIQGPQPNHAWRHTFIATARHIEMDREIEGFLTGHSTGKTSADYGPRWIKTLSKAIGKMPRFNVDTTKTYPHKRVRRTPEQIAVDNVAKVAGKAARGRRAA